MHEAPGLGWEDQPASPSWVGLAISWISAYDFLFSGVPQGAAGCGRLPHEFLAPHILPGTSSYSRTPALAALKLGRGECVLWRRTPLEPALGCLAQAQAKVQAREIVQLNV